MQATSPIPAAADPLAQRAAPRLCTTPRPAQSDFELLPRSSAESEPPRQFEGDLNDGGADRQPKQVE
jgi:hypothetical protein